MAASVNKVQEIVKPRARRNCPRTELTPLQLRRWAHAEMWKAIEDGRLPRAADAGAKCMDCGEPATCYDHRNYYHPLAVDLVCKGCNNRRGPGFPIDPEGKYKTAAPGGNSGHKWSNLEGGVRDQRP